MDFNKRLREAKERFNAGLAALKNADYQKVSDESLKAAELYKGIKGQELNYADALVNAANALIKLGEYEKAKNYFEKAISVKKKFLDANHPNIASSLNNLATIYQKQGNYERAKLLYEKALAIWEKNLGSEHPNITSSLNYLGEIYRLQGNYEQAKQLHEKALSIKEKILGFQHPNIALSLNNLAVIYQEQGNTQKAEEYAQRAQIIIKQVFDENHPIAQLISNNYFELQKQVSEQKAEIERLKKLEYLSAMATGISHSINNPVGILRLAAQRGLRELARNNLTPEKATEIFEKILTQLDRLHHITSGFRKFAAGDRSTIESVDLNALAQQMQEYFTNQLNNHKINLILELSPTPPHCQANSFILQEALINLINNAREALESEKIPDATIWLKTYQHAEKVGIIVEDNGKGIAESLQSTLFAPFHSSKAHGMGLGLYFAHKSLAEIKGTLSYQTRSPNGASFTIEFNGEKHEN